MKKAIITAFILIIAMAFVISLILNKDDNSPSITGKSSFAGDFSLIIDPGIKVLYFIFNGNTTGFLYLNDSELEIIENLTLEKVGYGKIIFNEIINITEDLDNNVIDLDNNANISYNRIEINITKLSSLAKSATLYVYNLSFNNPRIMRDGDACPYSICQIQSYSNGLLIFNVSQFSLYYAEEQDLPIPLREGDGGKTEAKTKNISSVEEKTKLPTIILPEKETSEKQETKIYDVIKEKFATIKEKKFNYKPIMIWLIILIIITLIFSSQRKFRKKNINITLSDKEKSYYNIKKNDNFRFSLNNTWYVLTIKKVSKNKVDFDFSLNSIKFSLDAGKGMMIKLDSNEKLYIRLKNIENKKADITLNKVTNKLRKTQIYEKREVAKFGLREKIAYQINNQ